MNKNRKSILLTFVFLSIIAAVIFYSSSIIKDNRIYVAEDKNKKENIARLESSVDVDTNSHFFDYKSLGIEASDSTMPLTLSSDKKTYYFMKPVKAAEAVKYPLIIKGATNYNVDLFTQDLASKKTVLIAENISFVYSAKWSPDGSMLALLAADSLKLYNAKENKFLLDNELKKLNISYCSWSPDSTKLYTEQPNLPNGIIININARKIIEAFENKEESYYKSILDEKHFIVEKQVINSTNPALSQSIIKLMSKDGTIIRDLSEGRVRDNYKQAILLLDKNSGLQYIQNFNQPQNITNVNNEPVYDVQFIYDGNIAYITLGQDPEENKFILHIVNSKAEELKALEVSGSNFLLLPDGKSIYINGPKQEKIDLVNGIIESSIDYILPSDINNIIKIVNGGVDVVYKFLLQQQISEGNTKKYFTEYLIQRGIPFMSSGDSLLKSLPTAIIKSNWRTSILLQNVRVFENQGKADVAIMVKGSAIWQEQLSGNFDLTLIKKDSKWYINDVTLKK